jgi:hypothetical protein
LELLAGLIDTDGHLTCNCYDYVSKSERLANDVVFLARSLGFAAYLTPCKKHCQTGIEGDYFRVSISGHTDQIPVILERKQATPRQQIKDVLHTGFTIKLLPEENYYGFKLDGDHRYLLGDFTITHNCGKTESAKALAEFLFNDEKALTRFDMSEFMERHMAQRLIGSPPGYHGAEQGGQLTEAVKSKPYSVLLFDEIEKAHPNVFDLLLQVLDDGRLTDGMGKIASFTDTVVIMTSNLGSNMILDTPKEVFASEEGRVQLKEDLLKEMKKFLRPEFINRIDDIVIFQQLPEEARKGIVDIQIRNLMKTEAIKKRGISIQITEEARNRIINIDYEPKFGARPLKRTITKHIQNPIAEMMVQGSSIDGKLITVDIDGNDGLKIIVP